MGYTLKIGNAKLEGGNESGELWARWSVEDMTHPDAPSFPNDANPGSNYRHPSYSTWADFARDTRLEYLFFDKGNGLLVNHPGCVPLNESHHTEVLAALQRWQAKSTKPPGFEGPGTYNQETKHWEPGVDVDRYDPTLARLMWVEWWMRWALKNCETPAFENA